MHASYNWLRTLVPQLTASPDEVAKLLTSGGLEVESVTTYGAAAAQCIVVEVRKVEPHPDRDSLRLVTVDVGGKEQTIVCGAPNVPGSGGLVVLAPLGTSLPPKTAGGEPFVVASRKIGSVVSEGMLCSEAELGLSGEGEGILILPPGAASPGAPLTAVMPEASDTIFEIGLTPNRPDGLGHVGLARELAAQLGFAWKRPEPTFPAAAGDSLGAAVRIAAPERCTHFATAIVHDVTVGESPAWLRYRLASLGVRSISNVVDITNLAMLEWGHPMHAYDLDALTPLAQAGELPDHAILDVRHASAGEILETLDGQKRQLDADDLVIADGKSAVGLAGVMGGASSEVKPTTTRLLLECAVFEPRGVRRTARRHGMHSEASHRFERGIDPTDVEQVLATAAQHLVRLCGGKIAGGLVHAGGAVRFPRTITLRKTRLHAVIGHAVPWLESLGTLQRLGLVRTDQDTLVVDAPDAAVTFEVPAHRPDLTREIDLVEEVLRLYGIDRIPARLPRIQPTRDVGGIESFTHRVRDAAVSLGLSEAIVLSLSNEEAMKKAHAPAPTVQLKNPLTSETGALITSVVPGLLDAAARAARHGELSARLFAVQTVFQRRGPNELPEERLAFAAVLTGPRPSWLEKPTSYDVWDAKGLATRLVETLGGSDIESSAGSAELHHPRARGQLTLKTSSTSPVASYGLLHPDVADAYGLTGAVVVVTLDLQVLARADLRARTYAPIPRFPASTRDVAIVVREGLAAGEVLRVLGERAGPLAESVELFDRYIGKGVPEGHVSLGFRIVYRKPDGTLTDVEVDGLHAQVVSEITNRFGATLRA